MAEKARSLIGSAAAEDSLVVQTESTVVEDIWVTSTAASTLYLMAFDAVSLPANSTVPDYVSTVPAGSTSGHDFQQGLRFPTGLVLALSTTADTLTVNTGSEGLFGALVVES